MESLTASYLLSLFSLITIADLSLSPNFHMEGEKLLPIVLRKPLHYVWHRSENKHSTSLPPLLPPLTPETLFILFMCWPARLLLVKLFVVCCFSWQNLRTAKHRTCAWSDLHCSHSCISLHQTVNQQSIWHAKGGGREGGRKRKVMPFSVCTVRRDPDWKTVWLFCQGCEVEQVVISRVSRDDIIPHVGVKMKPSHTHTQKYEEKQ